MALIDFLRELDEEVSTVVASDFEVEVVETKYVPTFDDSYITYDNLDSKIKRCKLLESCVLYVDIRNSARISAAKQPKTLAKMYSSFVRSMIAAARYFGGHVRNIIGDRVMVVFDQENCFENAVDTAILMNTISKHILNNRIKALDFRCGIGIDYGQMLITKAGAIRRGAETEFYRSLVWLGRPANTASRLTDLAHKTETSYLPGVAEGHHYPVTDKWGWYDYTYEQFLERLEITYSPQLRHKEPYFKTFFTKSIGPYKHTHPAILMSGVVHAGFVDARPSDSSIQQGWWRRQDIKVKDYAGDVYGGDVVFSAVYDL
ncbi:MAG: adenylate/guanylate cyclase domain-containing protein [Gemmatimonadota bacterium]